MRRVELLLTPTEPAFDPVGQAFVDEPAVTRRVLHQIRMLDDGTGILLCELEGSRSRMETLCEDHPDVLEYDVSEMADRLYLFIHQKLSETATSLLAISQEYEHIVDPPTEYTEDGGLRATLLGDQETLQKSLAAIPDTVNLSVRGIGEYHPETDRLFAQLTERQQETVTVAVEMGYFSDPRRTTYRDLGDELGCGHETVGEHLRKAQATIFAELVP